ncbi:MAG: hypothetical protein J6H19_03720, partial [Bacteroidaceae bacterium]|nr:hypothetical protein [Bacteroidaceae bacterium]
DFALQIYTEKPFRPHFARKKSYFVRDENGVGPHENGFGNNENGFGNNENAVRRGLRWFARAGIW